MDRRTMMAALATGAATWGLDLDAQENQAVDPSLYIPKVQRVEDREFLFDFMDRFAFPDVITATPTLRRSRSTRKPVLGSSGSRHRVAG